MSFSGDPHGLLHGPGLAQKSPHALDERLQRGEIRFSGAQVLVDSRHLLRPGHVRERSLGQSGFGLQLARQCHQLLGSLLGREHVLLLLHTPRGGDDDVQATLSAASARGLVQHAQLPHVLWEDGAAHDYAIEDGVGSIASVADARRLHAVLDRARWVVPHHDVLVALVEVQRLVARASEVRYDGSLHDP